jgi:hypothetical protein
MHFDRAIGASIQEAARVTTPLMTPRTRGESDTWLMGDSYVQAESPPRSPRKRGEAVQCQRTYGAVAP